MVNYLARFVPHRASIAHPLNKLLSSEEVLGVGPAATSSIRNLEKGVGIANGIGPVQGGETYDDFS